MLRRFPLTLVALCLAGGPALAQSSTGRITGVVTDASHLAVPSARVAVRSDSTGVARAAVADAAGRYDVADLLPGPYTVSVAAAGFTTATRPAVVVIGASSTIDVSLTLAGIAETVAVTAESSPLDRRATGTGGVVSRTQIEELPLNGRNFLQLAALQPGVVVSRATGREFTSGFGTTPLAIAGARPEQTAFLLDGTNIADISDKSPAGLAGAMLGVDAVQEFSVQTHGYSAEFGRAAGGVVSIATKSGTNTFRGSAFEFHRDSALDARGYFDPENPPSFLRNQFGGSLGGPIVKSQLFFFGSVEALRSRNVVTRAARLPDAAAHQGLLPDGKGGVKQVTVDPGVRPYLDLLFPIPDGADFGDGTAEMRHTHRDPTDETLVVSRIDWYTSSQGRVSVRYSHDTSAAAVSQEHPLFVDHLTAGTDYFTAQHVRAFGNNVANEVRVALNRTRRTDDILPTVEIPRDLYFTTDPHFGAITVIGLTQAGSTNAIPADYDQRLFQLVDTVTWRRAAHSVKAGIDWQHYGFQGFSYSRFGGEFRFRNLEEFLTLHRSSKAQADRFTGNMPGTDTRRHTSQQYVAAFAQDEWQVARSLTLNAGLRYEVVTAPGERDGLVAGLLSLDDLESGPHGVTPGTPLFQAPSGSVAPRLGMNWAPGDGRMTITAGYGIFVQPLTVSYYRNTIFRVYPYFAGVDIRQPPVFGPGIQDVLESGVAAQKRSEFIAYDARQPYTGQWHVRVERELGGAVTAEVGYLGSRGHHLPFYGDPNSVPSEYVDGRKTVIQGAGLRYPSWGRIRTRIDVARSLGNALVLGVRRRTRNGLTLQGSYTYAHSNDTWSGQQGSSDFENGAGSATDWWDPDAEYGPSNFDVRHSLAINAVYDLPWGRELAGWRGALARGWSVAGIFQAASGLPFTPFIGFDQAHDLQSDADTIQKPDQVGPVRYLGTPEAWFDVTAFALPPAGTYGNAHRNTLRGPGLKVADLAVTRDFEMRHVRTQIRVEVFNLFNWVNFGLPDASVMFNADGSYFPGAGRITTTATTARQVQLGVKLIF